MKRRFFTLAFLLLTTAMTAPAQTDSLDIKIGQMLLIGFPGTKIDSAVLGDVQKGRVGSIIIFEKNIPPSNSFVELKKITWAFQQASPIPLIIAIDQEGGRVNRLKSKYGFPNSITAAAMAKSPTLDSVQFYAETTASTLAGLGINMNFAPVVDLSSNPDNPIIARFGRAFSANADSVTLMAKEFILQHRKYGVLTALKHFPGHGSSKADTHLGIADVTATWNESELIPYRNLIDSGYTDAVMTAHIVNKNLDTNGNPGTLSQSIITGILRQRLNFNGVVFSDDMQMHAIAKHFGLEESIRMAINAGVDIMTFSNNISGTEESTASKVHGIIRKMIETGQISRQRIDESYRRIMKLKERLKPAGQVMAEQQRQLQDSIRERDSLTRANAELKEQLEAGKKKKKSRKKKS